MTPIDIKLIKHVFFGETSFKTGFILIPLPLKVLIKIEYFLGLSENDSKIS